MTEYCKLTRQQQRKQQRDVARAQKSSFLTRWQTVGERLAGKNMHEGQLLIEKVDEHLAAVVLSVHESCLDHLATHLYEAAEVWILENGDFEDAGGEA
jgi:hypothetical protein